MTAMQARPNSQTTALMASPEDTEQQFYEPLQTAGLARLMDVWVEDDEVSCIHPGGPRVVGLGAIRLAFANVFSQGAINAHPERARRLQSHDTAVHQVLERVHVAGPGGQAQSACVIATNVHLKTALGWRMVVHHASPGTSHDVQEVAAEAATLH